MVNWRPVAAGLVALFLCFGLWLAVSDKFFIETVGSTKFGMGMNSDAYPVAAADLIVEQDLQGPLYNELSFGGYLIHRLYPERKIFIDGRNELYGKEFYTRYIDTLVNPEQWYDLARDHNLQLALLNVRSPINDLKTIFIVGDIDRLSIYGQVLGETLYLQKTKKIITQLRLNLLKRLLKKSMK